MNKRIELITLDSTDGIQLQVASDVDHGEILDTRIEVITTGTLCWVSGEHREAFIQALNHLISSYRI
jgi:hypothetical protein